MTDETGFTEADLLAMWEAGEPVALERRERTTRAMFEVYKDKSGQYRWRLEGPSRHVVADSNVGFNSKAACLADIEAVRRIAAQAAVCEVA